MRGGGLRLRYAERKTPMTGGAGKPPAPKVVVVGAGLAGMAAAHALRKRGCDVAVLEAAPYPGGRILGRKMDGFRIDMGANLFFETYGAVRELAEELGVALRRTRLPIHSGLYRNGKFHALHGGDRLADQWKTARSLLSFRLLSPKGAWQALKFTRMLKARSGDWSFDDHSRMLDLDTSESAAEFFAARLGAESLEWFFGPGLSGYTFAHPEQIGKAYAMAATWEFGANGVAWPLIPQGGVGVFADALARACGDSIKLSAPVRRIVLEDGAVNGVVAEEGWVKADAVICATTATTALKIMPGLPPDIADALRKVTYSKCLRVFFGVDSSPFPPHWYAVAFPRPTGALIAGMSHLTALTPEAAPEGKALIDALAIGERAEELMALSVEQAAGRVLAEIRQYLPAMPAQPLFSCVHGWDEAACPAPGGMMKALHEMRRRSLGSVEGLFLAGEYMAVPSANGALRSGMAAAADCASFLAGPAGQRGRAGR